MPILIVLLLSLPAFPQDSGSRLTPGFSEIKRDESRNTQLPDTQNTDNNSDRIESSPGFDAVQVFEQLKSLKEQLGGMQEKLDRQSEEMAGLTQIPERVRYLQNLVKTPLFAKLIALSTDKDFMKGANELVRYQGWSQLGTTLLVSFFVLLLLKSWILSKLAHQKWVLRTLANIGLSAVVLWAVIYMIPAIALGSSYQSMVRALLRILA